MQAIIPHKDALFQLAQAARRAITAYNRPLPPADWADPCFPLWAFADRLPDGLGAISILPPRREGRSLVFPLEAPGAGQARPYRIAFATLRASAREDAPGEAPLPQEGFPLLQRVYRIGDVAPLPHAWQVLGERWVKARRP